MTATRRARLRTVLLGLPLLVLAACGGGGSGLAEDDTPVVQTTNYPLYYFATRLAGDAADVRFRAPSDGDPAFWEPTDEDVAAMQAADLILINGATYEKWMGGASLPAGRIVDTSAGFADRYIETEAEDSHSHGDGEEHSHGGTAFTTWIDLQLAIEQVRAIRGAMIEAMPEAEVDVSRRADELIGELQSLDAQMVSAAQAVADRPFVASHPVYQYFARHYGLSIEPLLWEPETVPDDAAMADLAAIRAEHPAAWMLWEGEPAEASVALLDGVGVRSVVIDPCGNRPDAGDFLDVMRANVAQLRSIAGDGG